MALFFDTGIGMGKTFLLYGNVNEKFFGPDLVERDQIQFEELKQMALADAEDENNYWNTVQKSKGEKFLRRGLYEGHIYIRHRI